MKKGKFYNFLTELKRRNVYKSALAYIVTGWIILQVLAVTLPSFDLPLSIIKWTVILLIAGFPFWIVFSWVYELTSEGLKKTVDVHPTESIAPQTSNRLNKIIIGALGIAIVLLLFNAFKQPSMNSLERQQALELDQSAATEENKSIAVLAFADMSPEKDQEYFSDGISEEILNLLAQIRDLRVISRTSSFSFKGQDVTTEHIGEVLDVDYVLEGSIRKSGNTLRITAQLINVDNGAHIWSKTYDRDLSDVLLIQDEIASQVAQQLSVSLTGKDLRARKVDPEAYTLFLQALYKEKWGSEESIKKVEQLLTRSIEIDSTYAPSWTALAMANFHLGQAFFAKSKEESFRDGLAALNKAIALDPNLATAYAYLSLYNATDFKFEEAAKNGRKAKQLAPQDAYIQMVVSFSDFSTPEELLENEKKYLAANPLTGDTSYNLAIYHFMLDNIEEAREILETLSLEQYQVPGTYSLLARVNLAEGKFEEALKNAKKETDEFFRLYTLNLVLFQMNKKDEANKILAEIIEAFPEEAFTIAEIYAFRGDKDQAFQWLSKAFEIKDPALVNNIYNQEFSTLYKDPRWRAFIDQIGLPAGHSVPLE